MLGIAWSSAHPSRCSLVVLSLEHSLYIVWCRNVFAYTYFVVYSGVFSVRDTNALILERLVGLILVRLDLGWSNTVGPDYN